MKDAFLKIFCIRSLVVYIVTYILVSLLFPNAYVGLFWILWGCTWATFFFCGIYYLNHYWKEIEEKKFIFLIFFIALIIRVLYVWLMCIFYKKMNGYPLEFGFADSYRYHEKAVALKTIVLNGQFGEFMELLANNKVVLSDLGYPVYLTIIYLIFGNNVLIPRIIQAIISAYMCVLIYKLSNRMFGQRTARTAGVMSVVMPLLIYYCGVHLKEIVMSFFLLLCIERVDFVMRERKKMVWNIFLIIFSLVSVFFYRISLGILLLFSITVFVLISKPEMVSKKVKIIGVSMAAVIFIILLISNFGWEMIWNFKSAYNGVNYNFQYLPGMFVLPLPKMMRYGSSNQGIQSGMIFAKNIIGFFAMYSFIVAYREKKIREISLIALMPLTYLAIVSSTRLFAMERFYMPVLTCLMVLAAYGMTSFRKKDLKLFNAYLVLLFFAMVMWSYNNSTL